MHLQADGREHVGTGHEGAPAQVEFDRTPSLSRLFILRWRVSYHVAPVEDSFRAFALHDLFSLSVQRIKTR